MTEYHVEDDAPTDWLSVNFFTNKCAIDKSTEHALNEDYRD